MPDPTASVPRERRRSVRQKLHTPVYASFNGPQTGFVVDLSELLDLHEEGFAVQTAERLEVNRPVTVCLDLPETRSFIHGTGHVVWSDQHGRGGIRFSPLSPGSQKILKEWLFANLLIGCSNHAARTEQLARRVREELSQLPPALPSDPSLVPVPAPSSLSLSLAAVRTEVRRLGEDVDSVFRFITSQALALTGAGGAALAFLTDDRMICRATVGDPAPPLGAPVDVKHGLSGECARSGLAVFCDDLENDPRVDPDVGRRLGVGSLMAVPIVFDFRVVGLLEVFSPLPHTFFPAHATTLERLVELLPKSPTAPPADSLRLEAKVPDVVPIQSGDRQPAAPRPTESASLPQVEESLPPTTLSAALLDLVDSEFAIPELLQPEPAPSERVRAQQAPPALETDHRESIRPDSAASASTEPDSAKPAPSKEIPPKAIPLGQSAQSLWEPDSERSTSVFSMPHAVPRSRLLHWALLGLVIAVIAMVLGYLLGPIIERRFADTSHVSSVAASQSSASRLTPVRSIEDLRILADKGDVDAQWQMAVRYHNGEGVPRDDVQAILWFQLAAEQGNVDAQSHLGAYYWAGRGVPEDLSKAYYWSTIAMAQGDEISKARLEGLSSQMTQAEVSAARQQAETWIHTHSHPAKSRAN